MPKAVITEKYVKERIKKILAIYEKYYPIYTYCPMTFGYGESGHPDRIILLYSTYIGVEVKKDVNNHHCRPELKAKPNEVMQKKQAEKIRASGGLWLCVHSGNLNELVNLLDAVTDTNYFNKFSEQDVKAIDKLVSI